MPYIRRTTYAGKTIRIDKYYSSRYGKQVTKGERQEVTDEKQEERNRQNAIRRLNALLNCNFVDGDFHCTFTYQIKNRPGSVEEAKKNYSMLMRALGKAYRKEGKEFKYIAVTEYQSKSIHHHIVLPRIDVTVLQKCWPFPERGKVLISPLNTDGEYYKLAEYLIKETDKTFKAGGMYGKRWNASKGLKQPVVVREIIEAKHFTNEPKPLKGYYIKKDVDFELNSCDDYGIPKQSYIMVKIE